MAKGDRTKSFRRKKGSAKGVYYFGSAATYDLTGDGDEFIIVAKNDQKLIEICLQLGCAVDDDLVQHVSLFSENDTSEAGK